jgi:hypothetical protein
MAGVGAKRCSTVAPSGRAEQRHVGQHLVARRGAHRDVEHRAEHRLVKHRQHAPGLHRLQLRGQDCVRLGPGRGSRRGTGLRRCVALHRGSACAAGRHRRRWAGRPAASGARWPWLRRLHQQAAGAAALLQLRTVGLQALGVQHDGRHSLACAKVDRDLAAEGVAVGVHVQDQLHCEGSTVVGNRVCVLRKSKRGCAHRVHGRARASRQALRRSQARTRKRCGHETSPEHAKLALQAADCGPRNSGRTSPWGIGHVENAGGCANPRCTTVLQGSSLEPVWAHQNNRAAEAALFAWLRPFTCRSAGKADRHPWRAAPGRCQTPQSQSRSWRSGR